MMKILLASQSPRRRELLAELGFDFETVKINVEEIFPENLAAEKVAPYLSELKAKAFRALEADEVLITADTVVVSENQILGKPKNQTEAMEMILSLSGKIHQVYTAFSLKTKNSLQTFTDVADVEFDEISNFEAEFYVKKYQPLDKAGSYGIQEWLGMAKIRRINGNFYTIMGLPTDLLYTELSRLSELYIKNNF